MTAELDTTATNSASLHWENQRFEPSGAHICDNAKLREPQVEALQAACTHFADTSSPAIMQLPVGCGKSGLAGLLSLELSTKRTLIVAPNTTIRRELFEELSSESPTNFWSKTVVIGDPADRPRVTLIVGPGTTMDECVHSDIVVTNIQQLVSSSKLWLYQFAPGFFDLVIFDEAHHTAADSWQKVIRNNAHARLVSCSAMSSTGTPYRRR
ncbi:DEAD/DEAH box helicase family protein [Brevibacterium renqingii]|uniref:DEAD/DEAH box helicase family protein n=1 Tax=Brevibacterium renqingii TaxID=2776916 RepID=UPI001ADF2BC5|nr:DEAD/DEAH box helicase family protein [Brevibacterium renqingii]